MGQLFELPRADERHAPISPQSAELYRRIAEFRRDLAARTDIPADALRDMLTRLLTATELLLQSNDDLERTLKRILERSDATAA